MFEIFGTLWHLTLRWPTISVSQMPRRLCILTYKMIVCFFRELHRHLAHLVRVTILFQNIVWRAYTSYSGILMPMALYILLALPSSPLPKRKSGREIESGSTIGCIHNGNDPSILHIVDSQCRFLRYICLVGRFQIHNNEVITRTRAGEGLASFGGTCVYRHKLSIKKETKSEIPKYEKLKK